MVKVRFAPSPTGFLHIGGLRTALYNYLFAKKLGGSMVLRIEDTDQNRLVEGAIEGLINSMNWVGIHHDEGPFINNDKIDQRGEKGPYIQSQRLLIYKKYIERLIENGWAYYCFCSKDRLEELREEQKAKGEFSKYDGHCRELSKKEVEEKINKGLEYVIRLKLPQNRIVEFDDIIRGHIKVNTEDLDDQVLIKSDGYPTYHFAVVVDDHLMGITHIIRGEEWLPSTPKHVLLYEGFGWESPKYVHLPNILNQDGKKLSKRHGDVAVEDFIKKGYLPEALVNYIALLGWSPGKDEEILSMEELIELFDLERVNKSGAVFDVNKLKWMNGHYIRGATTERITQLSIPYLLDSGYITKEDIENRYDWIEMMVESLKDKISILSEIPERAELFFKDEIIFENQECEKILQGEQIPILVEALKEKIASTKDLNPQAARDIFKEIQKEKGIKGKNLFMPVRIMLTGQMQGPDLMKIITVLGKESILNRLDNLKK
ncbi:MAG TPA: glutamate--tRNA ligase [Eubacteriaceae bacterium]|nr:glutamate--tRNA ligase [Eubacteriaceae bacterium]